MKIFYLLVPIILLCISKIMFPKSKNFNIPETVEFYLPENYNSAEIGFLYKGKATRKHVLSLFVYLAHKGYLQIERIYSENFIQNSFILKKLKDYDGKSDIERIFLEGLFSKKNTVSLNDINSDFDVAVSKILSIMNSPENINKIIDESSLSKYYKLIAVGLLCLGVILYTPVIYSFGLRDSFQVSPLNIIVVAFFINKLLTKNKIINFYSKYPVFFYTILIIYYVLFLSGYKLLLCFLASPILIPIFIVGLYCFIIIYKTIKTANLRTEYGQEMLTKLKGFKKFLTVTEKSKIDTFAKEVPNYFFDTLPFAYVLDVSDKWIKSFEGVLPDWYSDSDIESSLENFNLLINDSILRSSNVKSKISINKMSGRNN